MNSDISHYLSKISLRFSLLETVMVLSYRERSLLGSIHLSTQPPVHCPIQEVVRKPKDKANRDKGQTNESDNEPGAKPRAQKVPFPIKDQLNAAPPHKKNKEEQQDDVDVNEEEYEEPAANPRVLIDRGAANPGGNDSRDEHNTRRYRSTVVPEKGPALHPPLRSDRCHGNNLALLRRLLLHLFVVCL
jgi:hypothetical protein